MPSPHGLDQAKRWGHDMIEIDALLTTGVPALVDLHGASPTGGQVTSESRPTDRLRPGDVIRESGAWVVVSDVRHNGIHGITTLAAITLERDTIRCTYAGTSAEVRTDTRIDAATLWKLVDLMDAGEAAHHAQVMAGAEQLAQYA